MESSSEKLRQKVETLNWQPSALRFAPNLLMLIMAIITLVVGGVIILLLFLVGFTQQKHRLSEMAYIQTEMISMLASQDRKSRSAPDGHHWEKAGGETLKKLEPLSRDDILISGKGEFVLGKIEGDKIVFLLSYHQKANKIHHTIPLEGTHLAEPMRRALKGLSGTGVLYDYHGKLVLASYRPIPGSGWGLVAKISIIDLLKPYIYIAVSTFIGAVFLVFLGSIFFFKILNPIIQRLRESSEYNRILFRDSPVGLVLSRMDGRFVDVNPAFCAITGFEESEMLEMSYWDITPGKYNAEESKRLQELDNNGYYGPYEKEYQHKDGYPVPINLSGRVIQVGNEKYIWSSVEDITQRKKYELKLKQAMLVFENTNENIIIMDNEKRIIQANRAFTRTTGYSLDEILNEDFHAILPGKHSQVPFHTIWNEVLLNGSWYGELWHKRKDETVFPTLQSITVIKNKRGETESYVSVFSDITERKAYEELLAHQASHDSLTGLANRVLFENRFTQIIDRAKRHGIRFALLYLDLNRFKEINDSLGHDAGDLLLKTVAERMLSVTRDEDFVARLGGDEFVILLSRINREGDAVLVAQKLIEVISHPVSTSLEPVHPKVSIGISIYPDHGTDIKVLLNNADKAMYSAKSDSTIDFALHGGNSLKSSL